MKPQTHAESDLSAERLPAGSNCLQHIEQLVFAYPQRPRLFDGLSASVPPGVCLVKGGDGRGKTTLLRLMAGELTPDAGALHIRQYSLAQHPAEYRQQVFRCDTQSSAFDQHTVDAYFAEQSVLWPTFSSTMLLEAVEGLALNEHLHKNIFMLSTGSRRKVWLAAAFAAGATITLLDEPFSALDAPSIRYVKARLQEASRDAMHGGAAQTSRAWVLADYAEPEGIMLAALIDLGD